MKNNGNLFIDLLFVAAGCILIYNLMTRPRIQRKRTLVDRHQELSEATEAVSSHIESIERLIDDMEENALSLIEPQRTTALTGVTELRAELTAIRNRFNRTPSSYKLLGAAKLYASEWRVHAYRNRLRQLEQTLST